MKIRLILMKWLSAILMGVVVVGTMSVTGCASAPQGPVNWDASHDSGP